MAKIIRIFILLVIILIFSSYYVFNYMNRKIITPYIVNTKKEINTTKERINFFWCFNFYTNENFDYENSFNYQKVVRVKKENKKKEKKEGIFKSISFLILDKMESVITKLMNLLYVADYFNFYSYYTDL